MEFSVDKCPEEANIPLTRGEVTVRTNSPWGLADQLDNTVQVLELV